MQAMGNIRNYQIAISILLLLNLPFTYIALSRGMSPNSLLYIQIAICAVTLCVRLLFSRYYAKISARSYVKEVLLPIVGVISLSLPIPLIIAYCFSGIAKFIVTIVTTFVFAGLSIWYIGLKDEERRTVTNLVKTKLLKR